MGTEIDHSIGGSVVDALLADGIFTPRAVTRDANSAAARALEARGCEVVEANTADKEAVRRAVEGAECVFAVSTAMLQNWGIETNDAMLTGDRPLYSRARAAAGQEHD